MRHGHSLVDAVDAQVGADMSHQELLSALHRLQVDLLTNDRDLAQAIRTQPVKFDRSVVYLKLEGGDVEQDDAIDRLFLRFKRLKPGQIYIVTEQQVKTQQFKSVVTKKDEDKSSASRRQHGD